MTADSNVIIEAHELSKWFGEVVAVNNLHVQIKRGVTGLLGPNGAGKSTFIKLCLGLLRPSRGHIHVLGSSPRHNPAVLREMGYCPELDHFFDNMTGYEFVYALNRYWGMTKQDAEKFTEKACELVSMTDRMDDPIEEYSKGMRQRIKIAQALATNPDLLFLDEPMSGLDPQGREEMYTLIRRLGDAGYGVVVSSHILYEVERVTDNVVLLYNGTVLAHGRVKEIRDLIDEHPHTIKINTPEPRALAKAFVGDTAVMQLDFLPGGLVVRTKDPNACYQILNDVMLERRHPIHGVQCSDDNLQSVFEYLVG
ncbi:MAG: ABC transporter ATP-binding protein [Candidatus Hydrogenedentes bacterium]|nr:ABC transporter ATP-binding protein [Candidatus Hydrogenedentota bacterium]